MLSVEAGESLVKSKQRVVDHGEVFTPAWLVEAMLDLISAESVRIDARVLEPACGSGNFLVAVLQRKLSSVQARYASSDFEQAHHALLALMSIYGIELLPDNAAECRSNILETAFHYLGRKLTQDWRRAAEAVVGANIIEADALSMLTTKGEPLIFPEWAYLGKGKYQRRDFRFDSLTQRSSIEGSLFEMFQEHEMFIPVREYIPMTIRELSQ